SIISSEDAAAQSRAVVTTWYDKGGRRSHAGVRSRSCHRQRDEVLTQRGLSLFRVVQVGCKDWARTFQERLELSILRVRDQGIVYDVYDRFVIAHFIVDVGFIECCAAQSLQFFYQLIAIAL